MLKKLLMVAALCGAVVSAYAGDAARAAAEKIVEMKDGSTLYVFKDGKMSMENKHGRTIRMKPGHVMEGKDGQRYVMVGNEVARLDSLLKDGHVGN